jgi:hypothetical protein
MNITNDICELGETFPNSENYNNCMFWFDKNETNFSKRSKTEKKHLAFNNYQKEYQKILLNALSKYENDDGIISPFIYSYYNNEKILYMTPGDNQTFLNEFNKIF